MLLSEFLDLLYETHTSTQAIELCCDFIVRQSDLELSALIILSRLRSSDHKAAVPRISGNVIRKAAFKLLKWPDEVVSKAFRFEGNPGAAFGRMVNPRCSANKEFTPSLMLECIKQFDVLKTAQQIGFLIDLTAEYSQRSVEWFLRLFGPGEGVALDTTLIVKALSRVWEITEIQITSLLENNQSLDRTKISNAAMKPSFGVYYPSAPIENADSGTMPDDEYISIIEPPGVLVQLHYSNDHQRMFLANGTDITGVFPEFEVPLKLAGNAILYGYIVAQQLGNQNVQEWFDRRLQLQQMDMFARFEAPCALCLFDAAMLHGVDMTRTIFHSRLTKLRQLQFAEPIFKLKYDLWKPSSADSNKQTHSQILIRKTALLYPNAKPNDYLRLSPYRFRATIVEASTEFGRESDPATTVTLALQDTAGRLVRVGSTSIKHLSAQMVRELNDLFERTTTKRRANSLILEPSVVLEVDCDGFAQSNRHISKTVLHQPKVIRWLRDTPVSNIDNIDRLPTSTGARK